MEIRPESENDYLKVEELVRNSFWNVYRPGAYEHFIVHNLRGDESFMENMAYVIEDDGKIIGDINYSVGEIRYENDVEPAVILGPVAVDITCQNQGLGSKLIRYTLKILEKENIPFVFVVGDENYYSRFGFKTASDYGIFLEATDLNDKNPFFMIKIFNRHKLRDGQVIFHIPDVFHVNQSDVDEFDRQFEFRKKLIKQGQLGV